MSNVTEGFTPVLKDKGGKTIATEQDMEKVGQPPAIFIMNRCQTRGHWVVWGPRCRVMKRKPKGREMVSLECKTCGDYIEWVPIS